VQLVLSKRSKSLQIQSVPRNVVVIDPNWQYPQSQRSRIYLAY